MDEMEFTEAESNMNDLVSEYQQYRMPPSTRRTLTMTTKKHPSQPKLPPKIYLNMQFVNIYVSYQQNCQSLHRAAFKTSKHTYHFDNCLQLLIDTLFIFITH